MNQDDKFDLILKKLEENEKKIKALEESAGKEGAGIKEEKKLVKEARAQEDKLDTILNKLEDAEDKINALEKGTRIAAEFTHNKTPESFLSKKNHFLGVQNGLLVLIVIVAAVAVVLYAFLALPAVQKTQAITTSGQYFLGPVGSSLGSDFITGLSNVSDQLQTVAEKQIAGTIQCSAPVAATSSSAASPGFCVLVMSDNNYDIIPIRIPANYSAPTLSQNNKITFVYIGAQGCPFCAQQRWALALALSNFGNFSNLFDDESATIDGSVPTVLFNFSSSLYNKYAALPPIYSSTGAAEAPYGDEYATPFLEGAYYTSNYINFEPFDELVSSFWINTSGLPSDIQDSVLLPAQEGFGIKDFSLGGVPFFDINNQYIFDGATVAPILFGQVSTVPPQYSTQKDILASIQNPASGSFGETALGAANIFTAQICTLLNNTAPVCKASYIRELQAKIANTTY